MSTNILTRLVLDTKGFDENLFKSKKNLKKFSATTDNVAAGVTKGMAKFAGYSAAIMSVVDSLHHAVVTNMEFEKSLSSLRSLTGVSAKDLNFFRTEALKMSMDSTQSARDMVEAYKLIGSQMPELLKNKEALSAVTREAVVLSDAAGMDVPTAAKALTGALNQMGASSRSASEYINILAAASQQGSADIPYLNKAIENAGGTASAVGIEFHELVAAIEAIAPRITDAASAGTNLRNIFLTLESSTNQNLKPSVVGLSAALKNLSSMHLNATQLTKMFGKESVTAAIAILQERDAFEALRTGIVNTDTAYAQANINLDNLSGSLSKLGTAWDGLINSFGLSNGILQKTVDGMKELVVWGTRALMNKKDLLEYDTQGEVKTYKDQMNLRIKNGASPQVAYEQTLADLRRYKPDAGNVEKYEERRRYASAQVLNSGRSKKYTDMLREAKENLALAVRDKEEFDIISKALLDNLTAINAEQTSKVNVDLSQITNSKEADAAISKLRDKLTTATSEGLRESIEKAIALIEEKKSSFIVTPDNKAAKGSIAELNEQIKKLQEDYVNAATVEARVAAQKTINELEAKKIELKAHVQLIVSRIENGEKDFEPISERGGNLSDLADRSGLTGKLDKLNTKEQTKDALDFSTALQTVANTISNVSSSFNEGAAGVFQYFANMANGAVQAATAIAALIPVKHEEANANMEAAVTGAASSVSGIPFVGAMLAVSAVMSLIAAMAAVPKFAKGGIIGGNSPEGDKLLARVNSGEMILNKKQQKSLYNMTNLDTRPLHVELGLESTKVRGSEMFLTLKNYMKETGKKFD